MTFVQTVRINAHELIRVNNSSDINPCWRTPAHNVNEKLSCHRRTTWHSWCLAVNCLTTVWKSHLKRYGTGEWPWRCQGHHKCRCHLGFLLVYMSLYCTVLEILPLSQCTWLPACELEKSFRIDLRQFKLQIMFAFRFICKHTVVNSTISLAVQELGRFQVAIVTFRERYNHASTSALIFTGRMLFLTPNQQCQNTEGKVKSQ